MSSSENGDKMQFNSLQNKSSNHPLSRRPVQAGLLLLLMSLLALVIFILPSLIEPSTAPQAQTEASSNNPASSSSIKPESPFQQAQMAKVRRQAQDILSEILPLQEKLEQLQVKDWAAEPFSAAFATAQQGDVHYKQQDFEPALSSYQKSLEELQGIQQSIGDVYQKSLNQGRAAIDNEQTDQAIVALTLAATLESELEVSENAQALLQRANVLEEVIDIVHKGDRFKKQQQWANALKLYQQALKLDPISNKARQAVTATQKKLTEQSFKQAMSSAYSTMQKKQYPQAKKYFKQALVISPQAKDAKAGLQQASEQLTQQNISRLSRQAQAYGQQEQWQQAVDAYQQALQQDPSFVSAKVGRIKSQARLTLDKNLNSTLSNPSQLQDVYKRTQAKSLLADARAIKSSGERLQQQISQLQVALIKASSPVKVSISSDGLTDVHIYKVKRLGKVAQQELTLTPGDYTVVGSRQGYQDIRRTLTVAHGSSNSLQVICSVKI